jgi:hypothetical protein
MSFRRDYLPLFRIRALHDSNGTALPAVQLRPTAQCSSRLADHQLLSRPTVQGLEVYYTLNPWHSSPLLAPISAPLQLDFSLQLPADFFSEFQPDFADARQLHLSNLAGDGSIKPGTSVTLTSTSTVSVADSIRILPGKFELPLGIPPGATAFEVRAWHDDTVLHSVPVNEMGAGPRLEFDLRRVGRGRFRLAPDNQPTQHTHVLLDNEVAASRAQGLVSIVLNQAQHLAPASGYQFEARFESR